MFPIERERDDYLHNKRYISIKNRIFPLKVEIQFFVYTLRLLLINMAVFSSLIWVKYFSFYTQIEPDQDIV